MHIYMHTLAYAYAKKGVQVYVQKGGSLLFGQILRVNAYVCECTCICSHTYAEFTSNGVWGLLFI